MKAIKGKRGYQFKRHNPDGEELTVEKFRKLTGLNDWSESKCNEAIQAINNFCKVLLGLKNNNTQPKDVSIDEFITLKKAA